VASGASPRAFYLKSNIASTSASSFSLLGAQGRSDLPQSGRQPIWGTGLKSLDLASLGGCQSCYARRQVEMQQNPTQSHYTTTASSTFESLWTYGPGPSLAFKRFPSSDYL
jgi:hypothetical protein